MRWDPAATCLLSLLVSTVLFGYGFLLPGLSTTTRVIEPRANRTGCRPSASAPRRTVVMVIDAWRWSFLDEDASPMHFVRNSVSNGRATVLQAHVQTPTVTMPRIKALTSGTVPSFASVLLNFHSQESDEDNWLRRAREANRRIVAYGDDTWHRLFPSLIEERSDGVTSFYVADYTQVDDNVTRHLDRELRGGEGGAEVVVLHYLGLDHIGHSLGGQSAKIEGKLREMDGIVERIHGLLTQHSEDYVFFVLGDHGMTKAGGHGGSSADETTVPVVVFTNQGRGANSNRPAPDIEQMDVCSTLSHLMGLSPPSLSIGLSFLHQLGDSVDGATTVAALRDDIGRIIDLTGDESIEDCVFALDRLLDSECRVRGETRGEVRETMGKCWREAREVQGKIINGASQYDMHAMIAGILIAGMTLLYLLRSLFHSSYRTLSSIPLSTQLLPLHLLSFLSSSFVEEEHEYWYYMLSTCLVATVIQGIRRKHTVDGSIVASLVLHRTAIAFTVGGRRRWTMEEGLLPPPLVGDVLPSITLPPSALHSLQSLGALLAFLPFLYPLLSPFRALPSLITMVGLLAAGSRHLAVAVSETSAGAVVWATAVVGVLTRSPLASSIAPLLLFLSRFELLPILALCKLMGEILAARREDGESLVATASCAAFFYQGIGNTLSSVDIASGYTGLTEYREWAVGAQILLNAYGPPIILVAEFVRCRRGITVDDRTRRNLLREVVLRQAVAMLGCQVALVLFSQHLFVWTVFAPRFLFQTAHLLVTVLVTVVLSIS